jgi:hypothetical protein
MFHNFLDFGIYSQFEVESIMGLLFVQLRYIPDKEILIPTRGSIYDANGDLLVSSISYYQIDIDRRAVSLWAKKQKMDLQEAYARISKVLSNSSALSAGDVLKRLNINDKLNSIQISNKIREMELDRIKDLQGKQICRPHQGRDSKNENQEQISGSHLLVQQYLHFFGLGFLRDQIDDAVSVFFLFFHRFLHIDHLALLFGGHKIAQFHPYQACHVLAAAQIVQLHHQFGVDVFFCCIAFLQLGEVFGLPHNLVGIPEMHESSHSQKH